MAKSRFRRRIGTILDADLTIEKVDSSLDRFNASLDEFNVQLAKFATTLDQFGEVVHKIDGVGDDMATVVARLGPVVDSVEGLTGPVRDLRSQVARLGRFGQSPKDEPVDEPG